jgi:CTP:molybdopterin cytidylyltransferase MocA
MSHQPALVVLAAGASTRLGEDKALARLADRPGGTALELLLAAGAALGDPRPLVVTGRSHAAIAAVLPPGVDVHANQRWSEGRTGSVRTAVSLRPGRDLCLAPVDVPLVPADVFAALAVEWSRRGAPARGWLGPYLLRDGARLYGHPVILGRELAGTLKRFPVEQPLSALRARAEPLLALEVESAAILDDLDSPADLARLRARLAELRPGETGSL